MVLVRTLMEDTLFESIQSVFSTQADFNLQPLEVGDLEQQELDTGDVLIVDTEFYRLVNEWMRHENRKLKVIVTGYYHDEEDIHQFTDNGKNIYVPKYALPVKLVDTVHELMIR